MKKALVAALVLTFVLSIAATASAAVLTPASFPDVQGKACADAVAKLEALGIAKGIDGKWMPDMPVTRAQFAAFAVRLLGLEGVVKYMAGPTKFADVPATHWASGYVNVAVAKKLLAGYPDGTFHPDENITFPQAATVLGRVLGYVNLPGEWPSNYMVVASENGLFEGVEFGGDVVTRGDMAIMLWNALTAQVVQYKYYSDLGIWDYEKLWDEKDKDPTLLLEKSLGAKLDSGRVMENANVVGTALTGKSIKLDGDTYAMPEKVDTSVILGHELDVIVKGSNVVFAEDVTPSANIITGTVKNNTPTELDVDGTTYAWGTATVYVNRARVASTTYLPVGARVTAFLKDGKVVFVAASSYQVADYLVKSTTETTTGEKTVTVVYHVWNSTGNNWAEVDAQTFKVAASTVITKDGKAASFGDIKAGDVAYVSYDPADAAAVKTATSIALYSSSVSGTVTGVRVGSGNVKYIKLGDTEYRVSTKAKVSLDGADKNVDQLAQLLNYSATLVLNADGYARVITGTTAGIVGLYAGLTDDQKSIKVNVKGNIVTAPLASGVTPPEGLAVGEPMIAKTDSAGKVRSVVELTPAVDNGEVSAVSSTAGKITVGSEVYSVAVDAPFLTPTGAYTTLASVKVGDRVSLYWTGSGAILFAKLNPTTTVKIHGKYLGYLQGEAAVTAYFDVRGSTVSYDVYDTSYTSVAVDDFVYAVVRADGKVEAIARLTTLAQDNAEIVTLNDDGTLTVRSNSAYAVVNPAGASLYDTDKSPIQASALKVGDKIDVYTYTDGSKTVTAVIQRVEKAAP